MFFWCFSTTTSAGLGRTNNYWTEKTVESHGVPPCSQCGLGSVFEDIIYNWFIFQEETCTRVLHRSGVEDPFHSTPRQVSIGFLVEPTGRWDIDYTPTKDAIVLHSYQIISSELPGGEGAGELRCRFSRSNGESPLYILHTYVTYAYICLVCI